MFSIRPLLLLLACLAYTRAWSGSPCLRYEPEIVEISGTIKRQVFPGPPNYSSIKGGDRPETYWILRLSEPICVLAASSDSGEVNVAEPSVAKLQILQIDYKRYRHLLGAKVRIKGRLTHAITGHHHTPVMIEVISLEPAP
jgi:hypothetical protein